MSAFKRVISTVNSFISYKTVLLQGGPHDGRITYCSGQCERVYMNGIGYYNWASHHFEYRQTAITPFYCVFELYDSVHS